MATYEKIPDSSLPLYKKFDIIDGREMLINYVVLVEVDSNWVEFSFEKFKRFSEKPSIRTPK